MLGLSPSKDTDTLKRDWGASQRVILESHLSLQRTHLPGFVQGGYKVLPRSQIPPFSSLHSSFCLLFFRALGLADLQNHAVLSVQSPCPHLYSLTYSLKNHWVHMSSNPFFWHWQYMWEKWRKDKLGKCQSNLGFWDYICKQANMTW